MRAGRDPADLRPRRPARASPSGSTSRAARRVGNGEAINDALGNLTPFAENTDDVLKVLRVQGGATRRLIRNTGVVFGALSERQGQLRSLIRNSNRVWAATARRNTQLADTFRVLPTFLRESRTTTTRLTKFAQRHEPADRPAAAGGPRALAHAPGPGRALARPEEPVPQPRSAREGVQARSPRRVRGPQQHAPAARPDRHLPAPVHPDRGLPRPLQEGDRRLLRRRLRP